MRLLKDKKAVVQKNKFCFNCLSPGHSASKCKSTFSCRHCKGKHHSELCHAPKSSDNPSAKGSKDGEDTTKEKPKGKAVVHNTDTDAQPSDDGSNDDSDSLDATQVNMGRSYELSSAEVFYLNKKEKQAQQLTCVGTVCVNNAIHKPYLICVPAITGSWTHSPNKSKRKKLANLMG